MDFYKVATIEDIEFIINNYFLNKFTSIKKYDY